MKTGGCTMLGAEMTSGRKGAELFELGHSAKHASTTDNPETPKKRRVGDGQPRVITIGCKWH